MIQSLRTALLASVALLTLGAGETGPGSIEARMSGAFGDFLVGRSAVQSSDFTTAAKYFEEALHDDPTVPELNSQAFLAALLAGQPQVNKLATLLPDNPLATLVLGDRDGKAGNWGAAQARFATLPPDQSAFQVLRPILLAWSEQGQGNPDAGLALLAPLVEGTRLRGLYALHAGLIADLAGRTDMAERYYKIAATDYGQLNLRVAVILASWQARSGHAAEAKHIIASLAAADGEFGMSRQGLEAELDRPVITSAAEGIAEGYFALAATVRQQSHELSEALVRLALDLRPGLTAARVLLSDIAATDKRPEAALAALSEIPGSDPLDPMIQLRRAALLDETGTTGEATTMLETLAAQHPDRPEPWAQLGDILRRKERFTEAVQAYGRAIDTLGVPSRANWPLFYARGIALERADQWGRAEADLQYALELAPDQPSILNYLAYSWAERGEHLDQAHAMLQRAMNTRANEGAYIDSFGWVLLRQGDTAGAIKQLERAVELEPEDTTINGHLGDALAASGRMREGGVPVAPRAQPQARCRRGQAAERQAGGLARHADAGGRARLRRTEVISPVRPGAASAPGPRSTCFCTFWAAGLTAITCSTAWRCFPDVGDVLTAAPGTGLSLEVTGPFAAGLDGEGDNLVLRAARALQREAGLSHGAALGLEKHLPVASGIGGGSADAAAALRLLDRIWGCNLPASRLADIALGLGADVPVCLTGDPARMGGIGERIGVAPALPHCGMVLANPGVPVATARRVPRPRRGLFPAGGASRALGRRGGAGGRAGCPVQRSRSPRHPSSPADRRRAGVAARATGLPVRPHERLGRDMLRSVRHAGGRVRGARGSAGLVVLGRRDAVTAYAARRSTLWSGGGWGVAKR